jgi:type II secretory pathway pseudopilin PulG
MTKGMRNIDLTGRKRRALRSAIAGFTMVELLITVVIGGLMVTSMVSFFVAQTKSARLANVRIEAVQRARFASELLRREMGLAGAGIPGAQPLLVYAGPNDFVFSVDLASSTPGDRIAVYQLPGAPLQTTEGADSGSVVLPNGSPYPLAWYGPSGTAGPAETIAISFVNLGGGEYALTRTVNSEPADTLLRGLKDLNGRDFFTYTVRQKDGQMRGVTGGPVFHQAAIHESAADTGRSALADSIKLVDVAFQVVVRGRRIGQTVERSFTLGVALKNAGLIRNAACGDPPILGVTPAATLTALTPLAITVTWPPAVDERGGEFDVQQYTLYRREMSEPQPKPIASIPPNPAVPSYMYTDTDLQAGKTYIYLLGATDCTPAQSGLGQSGTVATP